MLNNPITHIDPNGDAVPLVAIAVAAVGGGIVNTASNWGNISSIADGINYFAVGAAGYGTSIVNPVAGGAILAGGNLVTGALNGSLAKSYANGTLGWDIGFTLLDGVGAGVTGKAVKSNIRGYLPKAEVAAFGKEGIKVSTSTAAAGISLKTFTKEATESVVVNTARSTAQMTAKEGLKLLGMGRFPKLDKHFLNHVVNRGEWEHFGNMNKNQYYKRAVDLADSPIGNDIRGFTSKDGWNFKYNIRSNEISIVNPKNQVSSFFRPSRGLDYYLDQIKLYGN